MQYGHAISPSIAEHDDDDRVCCDREDGVGWKAHRTRELGDDVAKTLGQHGAMILRGHGVNVADKDIRRVCIMTLWMEEAANYQLRAMSAGKPRYFTPEELAVIYPQVSGEEVSNRAWEYFSSRVESLARAT